MIEHHHPESADYRYSPYVWLRFGSTVFGTRKQGDDLALSRMFASPVDCFLIYLILLALFLFV